MYIFCKQKTKKKLGLNTGATSVGHGCQTLVNKTKRKVPSKKTSNCSLKKKKKKTKTNLSLSYTKQNINFFFY